LTLCFPSRSRDSIPTSFVGPVSHRTAVQFLCSCLSDLWSYPVLSFFPTMFRPHSSCSEPFLLLPSALASRPKRAGDSVASFFLPEPLHTPSAFLPLLFPLHLKNAVCRDLSGLLQYLKPSYISPLAFMRVSQVVLWPETTHVGPASCASFFTSLSAAH